MQLALLLAVVMAFAVSETAPQTAAAAGAGKAILVGLATIALALFSIAGSRWAMRCNARGERLQQIHLAAWCAVMLLVFVPLQWPRLVRFNFGLDGSILIDELLMLAPIIAPWLVAWAAWFDLEPAADCNGNAPRSSRWCFVWFCVRHHLGLLLVPVAVLVGWQDLLHVAAPNLLKGPYSGIAYAFPLVGVVLSLPLLLRYTWTTEPFPPGAAQRQLNAAARQAGLRARLLLWRTNGQLANAVIAGFTPWLRSVVVSDGMLTLLSPGELSAVVMHEAAHVRRHHFLLRMMALLPLLAIWPVCQSSLSAASHWFYFCAVVGAAAAICGGYCYFVFGWLAKLLEHDADLWACGFDRDRAASLGADDAVAENLIAALEKLEPPAGRGAASWLHPSIDARIELLRRAAANTRIADRFRHRVNLIGAGIIGLSAALLVTVVLNQ